MFTIFEVRDKVRYGTFRDQCEKFVKDVVDVRRTVEEIILDPPVSSKEALVSVFRGGGAGRRGRAGKKQLPAPPRFPRRVLLIDELDAFLNPETYSQQYNIYTKVPGKLVNVSGEDSGKNFQGKEKSDYLEIEALIDFVWSLEKGFRGKEKESNIASTLVKEVLASVQYGNFKRVYSHCMELMDEIIKAMISDLISYETQADYEVRDGSIWYKEADGQSNKIVHGHKVTIQ